MVLDCSSIPLTCVSPPNLNPFSGESQLLTFLWSEAGATGFDEIGTELFQVYSRDPLLVISGCALRLFQHFRPDTTLARPAMPSRMPFSHPPCYSFPSPPLWSNEARSVRRHVRSIFGRIFGAARQTQTSLKDCARRYITAHAVCGKVVSAVNGSWEMPICPW